jgi:hypothetical protein
MTIRRDKPFCSVAYRRSDEAGIVFATTWALRAVPAEAAQEISNQVKPKKSYPLTTSHPLTNLTSSLLKFDILLDYTCFK